MKVIYEDGYSREYEFGSRLVGLKRNGHRPVQLVISRAEDLESNLYWVRDLTQEEMQTYLSKCVACLKPGHGTVTYTD